MEHNYQNVYWSGEKFILNADVTGKVQSVTATIWEHKSGGWKNTGISSTMTNSNKKNGKAFIYTSSLWRSNFSTKWGLNGAQQLKIIFTATYAHGKIKTDEVEVIIDNTTPWNAHRWSLTE